MPGEPAQVVDFVPARGWLAIGVLVVGVALAYLVGMVGRRALVRAGLSEATEGTAFERTAREFGSSTAAIVAWLGGALVAALAAVTALTVANVQFAGFIRDDLTFYLPQVFVAILLLIAGIVLGDKIELLIAERLRSVKLPEVGVLPSAAKYAVIVVSVLLALEQIDVATDALVALLRIAALGTVVFTAIALWDVLPSGAAGIYLLLTQPYGIGDEVLIGDRRGIVQEVDVLVTRIESDDEEYIVPNRRVFRDGIVRVR